MQSLSTFLQYTNKIGTTKKRNVMWSFTTTGSETSKLMPLIEDLEAPPLVDEYGSELQDVIIQHWGSIRTYASHGPVQSRYNIRLMMSDIGGLELGHIFAAQTTAFKINISYGFLLRNRTSNRYRYYHSSCNCCGRYLDEPDHERRNFPDFP